MNESKKLIVDLKQAQVIEHAADFWHKNNIQTAQQHKKCINSLYTRLFNWHKLAHFFFWIASFLFVYTVLSILNILLLSERQLFIVFSVFSAMSFLCGRRQLQDSKNHHCAGSMLYILGLLFLSTAWAQISQWPYLWTALSGTAAAWYLESNLIWGLSLALFGLWLGQENPQYTIDPSSVSLESLIPAHDSRKYSALFGLVTTGMAIIFNNYTSTKGIYRSTLITGYVFLFSSLLVLAVDIEETLSTQEAIFWSVLLTLLCIGAIYCGIKNRLRITLRFGVVFLLLNSFFQFINLISELLPPLASLILIATSSWILGYIAQYIGDHTEEKF